MAVNKPLPTALIRQREEEAEIQAHPDFQYLSRPGDGQTRYVFQQQICHSRAEALGYVRGLKLQKIMEQEMEKMEPELTFGMCDCGRLRPCPQHESRLFLAVNRPTSRRQFDDLARATREKGA